MRKVCHQINKDSKVLFISLADTSYSRSGLLVGNSFINSYAIRLKEGISRYSQLKEIFLQDPKIEAVIVMSPSHLLVITLRRFYKGFIILDAGWPLSDSIENSELFFLTRIGKKIKAYFVDFIAFKLSDLVYLESNQQAGYCHKKFLISRKKVKVRYTGSLERIQSTKDRDFRETIHVSCNNCNPVVFRGKYNKESGLELLSGVARALDPSVHLIVLCPNIPKKIKFPRMPNITVVTEFLPIHELESVMSTAKLMIGQLGNSQRLDRTIPHKFFESARLGIPYLTPMRKAIQEITNEDCIYYVSNEDEEILANQISTILHDRELLVKKGENFKIMYEKKLSNAVLAKNFMKEVTE